MLTVGELVAGLDMRVLAGDAGLDRRVQSVHTSDLLDPTPWLRGGELLLTNGSQLDSPARQRDFIARLADRQLAGLGVAAGFADRGIPPALLKAATARDFPLLEVPEGVPFIAVTEAALERLANGRRSALRTALDVHDKLERVALSDLGLGGLLEELAALIGAAVVVFDAAGEQLAQGLRSMPIAPDVLSALREEARTLARRRERRAVSMAYGEGRVRGIALPVRGGQSAHSGVDASAAAEPQAWLIAVKDSGTLSEVDRLVLRQAVTIVALELRRSRVAEQTERRLASDVLAALLGGRLTGLELAERLEPFGLGPSDSVAAILVRHPDDGRRSRTALEVALSAALRREGAPSLVASSGAILYALVPGLPDEDLFALTRRTAIRIAADLGAGVGLGVGRAVSIADATRSINEARSALEAQAQVASKFDAGHGSAPRAAVPQIATFRDLGSSELFLSLHDADVLQRFFDAILGPVEQTKPQYGRELLQSLDVFLDENGQWDRAARRLCCHRHTLRYRINKVEELTGRTIEDARDRVEFWLALRVRELLPNPRQRTAAVAQGREPAGHSGPASQR